LTDGLKGDKFYPMLITFSPIFRNPNQWFYLVNDKEIKLNVSLLLMSRNCGESREIVGSQIRYSYSEGRLVAVKTTRHKPITGVELVETVPTKETYGHIQATADSSTKQTPIHKRRVHYSADSLVVTVTFEGGAHHHYAFDAKRNGRVALPRGDTVEGSRRRSSSKVQLARIRTTKKEKTERTKATIETKK
jgi:hypothetical protein